MSSYPDSNTGTSLHNYRQALPVGSDVGRLSRSRSFSERLGHIAASDFARKVAETYATQIVLLGLSLITSIMVARTLGPQGRGSYAVAMAMGLVGVQLCNLGLHASNTYYLARDRRLLSTLLGNSLLVSFGLGGVLAVLTYLIFLFWPGSAPVPGLLLFLSLAWIPVGVAFLLLENLLLGLQDVRSYNVTEILNRVLAFILVGVVIFNRRTRPETVFLAMLTSMIVATSWTFARVMKIARKFPNSSLQTLTNHFRLGIKAYLIALFGFLLLRIDLFMVKYFLGAEQAGYYSIASTMADYVLMLPSVIGLILFPRLSSLQDSGEKFRQAKKAAKGTALALLPVLLVGGILAKSVITILFGRAFLPAAGAFLWLIPGVFAMGVETTLVQFLNSLGYPRGIVWMWFFATVANVLLNLWLIPAYGIAGASLASTVCYSSVFLVVLALTWAKSRPQTKFAL